MHITLTDSNKVLIDYARVWKVVKDKIDEMCNGLEGEYSNDLMKVEINSDDYLLVNKVIKFHVLIFTIRHVFKKGNKYCPQIFLADCLYDDV